MATTVAASKGGAAAQPDPATLSARERIRLHVHRNIQQQAQQAKLLQGGATASAGTKKGQAQENGRPTASSSSSSSGSSRKRASDPVEEARDGSPTWETNTPPSGLSIDLPSAKRARLQNGLYEGEDEQDGDGYDEGEGLARSPQEGMLASGIDAPINISMELGSSLYTRGDEEEQGEETPSTGLGLCDSPPCEVCRVPIFSRGPPEREQWRQVHGGEDYAHWHGDGLKHIVLLVVATSTCVIPWGGHAHRRAEIDLLCIIPPPASDHAMLDIQMTDARFGAAFQVSWNGSEVPSEPVADQSLNASVSHPVDEDWVKGLYDMEGME